MPRAPCEQACKTMAFIQILTAAHIGCFELPAAALQLFGVGLAATAALDFALFATGLAAELVLAPNTKVSVKISNTTPSACRHRKCPVL